MSGANVVSLEIQSWGSPRILIGGWHYQKFHCVLFWLVTVTPCKPRFLTAKSRKDENSKGRKVCSSGDFCSKSRTKIENLKSRKNRIIENFWTFLFFDFLRKASLEKWQIAWGFRGVGAQAVCTQMFFFAVLLLFFGCFFCSLSRGAQRKPAITSTGSYCLHDVVDSSSFVGFERVDTGNPQMVGLHNSYLRDLTMVIKLVSGSGLGILTY